MHLNYITNTWFLANVLVPVVVLAGLLLYSDGSYSTISAEDTGLLIFTFFASLLLSIPSLFLMVLIFPRLMRLSLPPFTGFFLWIFLCLLIAAANCFLYVLFWGIDEDSLDAGLLGSLTACTAAALSCLFRVRQYFKCVHNERNPPPL